MHYLDSEKSYLLHDADDVGFGIDRLSEQLRIAWHDAQALIFPKRYAKSTGIACVGMGGSALGAEMAEMVALKRAKVPMAIVRDYQLPAWIQQKTLVILVSFSGSTEEVLAAAEDALRRKSNIVVVATGGPLVMWAEEQGIPAYTFSPGELAKQPRFGTGFLFAGILGILAKNSLISLKEDELRRGLSAMSEVTDLCASDVGFSENPAKQVADALSEREVIVFAAEHLCAHAHVLVNNLHETAKQRAVVELLPEANHHLLESFSHPQGSADRTTGLFFHSELYHPRIRRRTALTADILEERGVRVVDYVARGKDFFEEMCEVLQFSYYVAWYTAILHKECTTEIPYVDAFKQAMAKKG